MRDIDENTITPAVLHAMAGCANPRLLGLMTSLVRHLHAFARETGLTEAEWEAGIRFLTEAGRITDDTRQEFILLSDVLGLSTLVTAQNNVKPAGCTESTVFGPFFVQDAPEAENGADIANGAAGTPCYVSGQVLGLDGTPIAHARLDAWQSDETGVYDVQMPGADGEFVPRARARLRADHTGRFRFRSVLAQCYPIPHDGPVGRLLAALGRHPWRPAHLHFMVQAPGYRRLITHIFRSDDPYLDSDAVFGVRQSLVADWVRHAPDAEHAAGYHTLQCDFVLHQAA